MESDTGLLSWLKTYLEQLPGGVDVEVLSDYIFGFLNDVDLSEGEEVKTELHDLLSGYLPEELCKNASEDIVQHLCQNKDAAPSVENIDLNSDNKNDGIFDLTNMEGRLRELMNANFQRELEAAKAKEPAPRAVVRDACTTAVLREAGVAGYQGDAKDEHSVELAIANEEFRVKQQHDAMMETTTVTAANGTFPSNGGTLNDEAVDSDLDIEELEHISGYGKKDDTKPGTVEDALSILNPSLFGTSCSIAAKPFPTKAQRLPTPCPRPSGQLPSNFSSLLSTTTPSTITRAQVLVTSEPDVSSRRQERKKKAPAPSKHIAKVASQAEVRRKAENDRVLPVAGENTRGVARARQDEMDAFLISDSEDPLPLPAKANNAERVKAAESAKRQASIEAEAKRKEQERASRTQQLDQAVQRKATAQKRAQKVERRR